MDQLKIIKDTAEEIQENNKMGICCVEYYRNGWNGFTKINKAIKEIRKEVKASIKLLGTSGINSKQIVREKLSALLGEEVK